MSKLESILSEILRIPVDQINDDLEAENCEQWGSLAQVQIISEIEETYEIDFDGMEAMDMDSVKNIKRILTEKGVDIDA